MEMKETILKTFAEVLEMQRALRLILHRDV